MKNLKALFALFFILYSFSALAEELCSAAPTPAQPLVDMLRDVCDKMAPETVTTLKVNFDGEGKITIFYENGVPKILFLTYKNKDGEKIKSITFDELAKGKSVFYENSKAPGKAIVLEKDGLFKQGNKYHLKFSIRTQYEPDQQFTSFPLELEAKPNASKVSTEGKEFKGITLSPGIKMFAWDGRFKKAEFN